MNSDKKNSAWLSINFISLSIISVITLKLNIDHYGKELFGIWIILSSIWGFSSTLDFGFGTTLIKYIAEYKNDSKERTSILLSSSIFVFIFIGIIIVLIGNLIAFGVYFNNIKIMPKNNRVEFIAIFSVLGVSFFIKYITIFFNSFFEGLSKFVITSKTTMLQTLLTFICVVTITILNLSLIYLAISYLLVSIIILTILLIIFNTKYKEYKINIKYFTRSEIKKVLKFSFSVQIISIFNAAIDPLVKYLIGNYYSVNSVPAYEIAKKFAVTISGLYFSAFKIILPKVSAIFSKEERTLFINTELAKYSKFGVLYSGLFYGVLLLPMIIFINYVFNIKEAAIIFVILCLPESINNYGFSIYNFLLGTGRVIFLASLQFINLFVTTISLIIGFKLFNNSLGLIGYFLSVLIGNILMVLFLSKYWKFNVRNFFVNVKIYKLLLLIIFLFVSTGLILHNSGSEYLLILILSTFMLFLFINDILQYTKLIISGLKNRN